MSPRIIDLPLATQLNETGFIPLDQETGTKKMPLSDVTTKSDLETSLTGKSDKSHTHIEYVTLTVLNNVLGNFNDILSTINQRLDVLEATVFPTTVETITDDVSRSL